MREACLDLHAARPPCSGLAHDGHELVAALDDPLGLDPELLEALQPPT
jgi:hypothetical protein